MSPLRYRLHRIKEAIFGEGEIIYELLAHYKMRLPTTDVAVSWKRDGAFIVGKVHIDNQTFIAQGRSAKEFVEGVNDALYAAYDVPLKYAERLGGDYRLTPPPKEFEALNNKAITQSSLVFDLLPA
jgi:hypothetical protein